MGPREIFGRMREQWLGGGQLDELLAEDVVIETPFAPPGRPRRFVGRAEFLNFARLERDALPVRLDEMRDVVVHETADPEVIVAEYELAGVVTTTGRRSAAPFIGVLRVRDGKVVLWREYQNMPAIAAAVGRLPDLLAAFGSGAAAGAAAAGDLGEDDAGGDGGVEGFDARGHRDGDGGVAGFADEAGQAAAFGADDDHQR